MKVSIAGASGYVGGELLRLLLEHPQAEIAQVTSESQVGRYVHHVHPNLRGRTRLKFTSASQLEACDLMFLALPHGSAQGQLDRFAGLAERLVDLSADFRLNDAALYERWYHHPHACPQRLGEFVYGMPELHREELKTARWATGAGCLATTAILGLYPLCRSDLLDRPVVYAEAKVGSSAAGNKPGLSSHHPERSGAIRSFGPTGHRHTAEMIQELGVEEIYFSATSIEAVRGCLVTAHVHLKPGTTEKDVIRLYRAAFKDEPFMRMVKETRGVYRYPEPKILSGSNYCDVGFALEEETSRLVVISALDNLVKGAAGNGVQTMNLMCGFPEPTGLDFAGLHPA